MNIALWMSDVQKRSELCGFHESTFGRLVTSGRQQMVELTIVYQEKCLSKGNGTRNALRASYMKLNGPFRVQEQLHFLGSGGCWDITKCINVGYVRAG